MHYLMVILATVLLAFDFAFSKKYQSSEGTGLVPGLKFNALNGLVTALVFFGISGFRVEFSLFSAIMAFFMSLFAIAYSIIGFRVLRSGNMAVYTIFLMSGGMLLPYIYGVLFLHEELTVFRILGVLIILGAVVLSNSSKTKCKASFLALCCLVFLLNGLVSIVSKCHQVSTAFPTVSSSAFVMYSGISKCLFSCAVLLFCRQTPKAPVFSGKHTVYIVVGSALIGGLSYMLQLLGAKELPATVLYPIVTGGSIVFSSLSGMVFFQEKPSRNQWISIALCFAGTLLFL